MHHATSTGIGKHWYRQTVTDTLANNTSQNKPTEQKRHNQAFTLASMLASNVSSHCALAPLPCYAGGNHHAPPPALAHLRWRHLAKCQVGLKACALPHTRPPVRPSMANCCAGFSKALQVKPHVARQTTTKQHNPAIHKVNTQALRQESIVTTEVSHDGLLTNVTHQYNGCVRTFIHDCSHQQQHTSAPSEKHCHYRGILRRLRRKQ